MELTEDAVSGFFPDAAYLVLSSRLVPDLDGGYTIATVARARQMAARGADVQLLTVDPADAAAHDAHREEFARRGMLPAEVPLRNLFDEAVAPGGERRRGCRMPWMRLALMLMPMPMPMRLPMRTPLSDDGCCPTRRAALSSRSR